MSKIKDAFTKGKAFIPFISAGDHGIETTERYIRVMVKASLILLMKIHPSVFRHSRYVFVATTR